MATKKYLSLDRLTEYDALIKQEIADSISGKADSSHSHDDKYYTESEIDSKISAINTNITNITNGSVVVKEAEHATSADSATSAVNATTAQNASTLGSTVEDTGSTTKPIYLDNGVAKVGSTYAGGTKVTLNGASKGGSTASFYAPTGAGTSGYILKSNGSGAPTWLETLPINNGGTGATTADAARTNLDVYSKSEVDSALSGKSDSTHHHNSDYDEKGAAAAALDSAKTYADNAATKVKDDLLNGAGAAYDTLKELGDLIVDNADAIDALETIASGKADAEHVHEIADVDGLQAALDGKAASSHGTHVTFDSTNKPKMDGTAAFGTSTKVARADHVHPTDTSRASKTEFDSHAADTTAHITSTERENWEEAYTHSQAAHAPSNAQANVIESIKVNGTAQTITSKAVNITVPTKASDIDAAAASHTHAISDITDLQTTLTNASSAIGANTNSITVLTDRTAALEAKVGDGFTEITSDEIQALFN